MSTDVSTKPLQMTSLTWGLLVLLSVLWGGSFFFVELALEEMPTLTVVFARVSLAALALHLYLLLRGQRIPLDPELWAAFFVMGLINNFIPFTLIVWGQVYIEGGLASILNATTPIFAVLLAHLLTKDERLTLHKLVGVVLGFLGVIVLIGPEALRGLGTNLLAQLAVIGAGLSYALAGIYGRRFKNVPSSFTAAGMLTCSAVILLPLSLIADEPWNLSVGMLSLSAVIALAVLSTAAAYLIYFYILSEAGATNVLLVTLLIPISAILLGVLFLNERLSLTAYVGMAFILTGLLAVDGRLFKRVA